MSIPIRITARPKSPHRSRNDVGYSGLLNGESPSFGDISAGNKTPLKGFCQNCRPPGISTFGGKPCTVKEGINYYRVHGLGLALSSEGKRDGSCKKCGHFLYYSRNYTVLPCWAQVSAEVLTETYE